MVMEIILIIVNQVDFFTKDRTRKPFPRRLESQKSRTYCDSRFQIKTWVTFLIHVRFYSFKNDYYPREIKELLVDPIYVKAKKNSKWEL